MLSTVNWKEKFYDIELTEKYFDLCSKDTDEPMFFEEHHIFPKSIWPEYEKCKWNLVKLTYKDHYKAHEILPFLCKNPKDKQKMWYAWVATSRLDGIEVDVDRFEALKKEWKLYNTQNRCGANHPQFGKPRTADEKAKMSIKQLGKYVSDETRKKQSEAQSGEKHPQFGKKGALNKLFKVPKTQEHRDKVSVANSTPVVIDGIPYKSSKEAKDKLKVTYRLISRYVSGELNTLIVDFEGAIYQSIGLLASALGITTKQAIHKVKKFHGIGHGPLYGRTRSN